MGGPGHGWWHRGGAEFLPFRMARAFARGRGGPGGFGGPHFGRPPFGGPPGFGGPGSPFRRGPRVGRGDVRDMMLSLLAERPLHGYQIMQEIGERSRGTWRPSPGSVYPALQQLADEGLVRSEETDGRRVFHLTDAGRAYVEAHKAELAAVWQTVEAGSDGRGELRDVAMQLGMAVMQVASAGTEAQIAAAKQILIETRRKLYGILAETDGGAASATSPIEQA